jgi:hypothetical protein
MESNPLFVSRHGVSSSNRLDTSSSKWHDTMFVCPIYYEI